MDEMLLPPPLLVGSLELRSPFGKNEHEEDGVQATATFDAEQKHEIPAIIKMIAKEAEAVEAGRGGQVDAMLSEYLVDLGSATRDDDTASYDACLRSLCAAFNAWSDKCRMAPSSSSSSTSETDNGRASQELVNFLMPLIYNRAVAEPSKLNQYKQFSPQVYGETGLDIVNELLERVHLQPSDIFVDLGSGVGNVVLHVAALARCRVCYGFEKAEWPAFYANAMEREFRLWMRFFAKRHSPFVLLKADFLSDDEFVLVGDTEPDTNVCAVQNRQQQQQQQGEERGQLISMNNYVQDILNRAKLVFVNNFAFGSLVDQQLKCRFGNMLEGSLIVSSKPFRALNSKITSRDLNDTASIMNVTAMAPIQGRVSWTGNLLTFHFHQIDRTMLERYFASIRSASSSRTEKSKQKKTNNQEHGHESQAAAAATSSSSCALDPPVSTKRASNGTSPASHLNPKRVATFSPSSKRPVDKRSIRRRSQSQNGARTSHRISASVSSHDESDETTTSSSDGSNPACNTSTMDVASVPAPPAADDVAHDVALTENGESDNHHVERLRLLEQNALTTTPQAPQAMATSSSLWPTEGLVSMYELFARQLIGNEVVDAIDTYTRMLRLKHIQFMMCNVADRASPMVEMWKQMVRCDLEHEMLANRELIRRRDETRQKLDEAISSKALQFGIADVSDQHSIVRFAQQLLVDHTNLCIASKLMESKVDIEKRKRNVAT